MSNDIFSSIDAAPLTVAEKSPLARLGSAFVSRLVIIVPYIWLLFFFLVPFIIVFKISLSQTAIAIPPYAPVLGFGDGIAGFIGQLKQLSLDNYEFLTEDALYVRAYLSSLEIAVLSTVLTLLVGYPIAYGMARAQRFRRARLDIGDRISDQKRQQRRDRSVGDAGNIGVEIKRVLRQP
jgi:putrescine transport system permease protein